MSVVILVMSRICSERVVPIAVAQEGESIAECPFDSFLLGDVCLAVLQLEDLSLDHCLCEG